MSGAANKEQGRQILGIQFYTGSAAEAVDRMEQGGLLVVPAAPALAELPHDSSYRDALLGADLVIPDSSLMVAMWNLVEQDDITRVSGLAYIQALLERPSIRQEGNAFWVMASEESAELNIAWLETQGVSVRPEDVYIAPLYKQGESDRIEDSLLLRRLNEHKPQHVVVTIGGGTQEQLGLYLRNHLEYRASIHCLGAAIAFLSGDQVRIPMWADQMYLGWLFRCASNPAKYGKRYWEARHLTSLLLQYRDQLPEPAAP